MTDEDLINLQKLTGRSPQPWSLPPEEPDHILYARAMQRLWPELAGELRPSREALMQADAVKPLAAQAMPGSRSTPHAILPAEPADVEAARARATPVQSHLK